MGRKSKYSKDLKLEIIKRYLNGESANALANEYGMTKRGEALVFKWVHRYEVLGKTAFETSKSNKSYSKEFKEIVIKEYLSGGISFCDLANKYKISSNTIGFQSIIMV